MSFSESILLYSISNAFNLSTKRFPFPFPFSFAAVPTTAFTRVPAVAATCGHFSRGAIAMTPTPRLKQRLERLCEAVAVGCFTSTCHGNGRHPTTPFHWLAPFLLCQHLLCMGQWSHHPWPPHFQPQEQPQQHPQHPKHQQGWTLCQSKALGKQSSGSVACDVDS